MKTITVNTWHYGSCRWKCRWNNKKYQEVVIYTNKIVRDDSQFTRLRFNYNTQLGKMTVRYDHVWILLISRAISITAFVSTGPRLRSVCDSYSYLFVNCSIVFPLFCILSAPILAHFKIENAQNNIIILYII